MVLHFVVGRVESDQEQCHEEVDKETQIDPDSQEVIVPWHKDGPEQLSDAQVLAAGMRVAARAVIMHSQAKFIILVVFVLVHRSDQIFLARLVFLLNFRQVKDKLVTFVSLSTRFLILLVLDERLLCLTLGAGLLISTAVFN